MGIELTLVQEEELPIVASLAAKIWQVHYPPIVGQEQVDYMLKRFYEFEALKKQHTEGQDFYLINKDNRNIGFISVSQKGVSNFFIHKFYMVASEQAKGLGEIVFVLIKTLFRSRERMTIELTVNRQNFKAINFYFKLGFRIKEVANFDIGDGYLMNDFVMEWKN